MLPDDRVIIKGVRDGLLILLDDNTAWPTLLAELDSRLTHRKAFFHGATVTVNLGARAMDAAEFSSLLNLLAEFAILLDVVVSLTAETRALAAAQGIRNRAPAFASREATPAEAPPAPPEPPGRLRGRPRRAAAPEPPALAPPLEGEPDFGALAGEDTSPAAEPTWAAGAPGALFVRRTLRSGMSIEHDGDVCILGDVNAGAQVVAGGDVVVWGIVRGLVHAGAGGDTAAVVCALVLAPTQLRIADLVSRGSAPVGPAAPEMARIAADHIAVEPWTPRRR